VRIDHDNGRATKVVTSSSAGQEEFSCDEVVSSMPIPRLVEAMDPAPPPEVMSAAAGLAFRDFLTVALVVPADEAFPDNWIYVHSPAVKLGRVQNFGAWSPEMIAAEGMTCLGLEYFVTEGDALWTAADEDLIELGASELATLGLVKPENVGRGFVVRMPKAYPMYDTDYVRNVDVLRDWLDRNVPNVHPVGRNGMHRYNNQDHSMYTAMLTVDNIVNNAGHDVWSVNVDAEYHEEISASEL